jgi:methionine-rich copper-binding protein CopC
VAIAVAAAVLSAVPAAAHDQLVSSDPAADSVVQSMPPALVLTYSATLLADLGGTEVQVTDASGSSLADGEPSITDSVVTQPLIAGASGPVTVLWRVVSEDGHPVSGEFSFTVAGTPAPSPTAPASEPATATATPSATVSQSPLATASAAPVQAAATASPVPWIVLGALVIAAVGAVVYLLVARGRRSPERPD